MKDRKRRERTEEANGCRVSVVVSSLSWPQPSKGSLCRPHLQCKNRDYSLLK